MKKSESIAALATALSKAQAEMGTAKKSSSNPFFKSKYADLEEVIHAIREPFTNHGLSFMQLAITEDDRAGVETIIMHESGEFISGEFMLKASKLDAQGLASAITYSRRYGLQAAAGLPCEDDDGNTASRSARAPQAKQSPAEPPKPCTEVQKENIVKLIEKAGFDVEKAKKAISWASSGRTEALTELQSTEAAKLIAFITTKISA